MLLHLSQVLQELQFMVIHYIQRGLQRSNIHSAMIADEAAKLEHK